MGICSMRFTLTTHRHVLFCVRISVVCIRVDNEIINTIVIVEEVLRWFGYYCLCLYYLYSTIYTFVGITVLNIVFGSSVFLNIGMTFLRTN